MIKHKRKKTTPVVLWVLSALSVLGGWLGRLSEPSVATPGPLSEPLRIAQGESLPPLPLPIGAQGTPSDPFAGQLIQVPQNPDLSSSPALNPYADPNSAAERYLVYIPGDSQNVLSQVQLVEPEAFINQYQGQQIIQAGVFTNLANAQRRARELEFQGVRAAIATFDSTPPINTSFSTPIASFAPPPPPSIQGSTSNASNAYFVIIPASREDLPRLIQETIATGITGVAIVPREVPLGPHLAIGPFPDRTTATQESNYLRQFGLDARIYYGK